MKFTIDLQDCTTYDVEADTKEEAIQQALAWWDERTPDMMVEEAE